MSLDLGQQTVADRLVRRLADIVYGLPIVDMPESLRGPYLQAAGRSAQGVQAMAAHIARGKFGVELETGASEKVEPETTGILTWQMTVVVVGYLPEPLPVDPFAGDPETVMTPTALAQSFQGAFNRIFDVLDETGRLIVRGPGNAILAQASEVSVVGGGGVGVDDGGLRVTAVPIDIKYRTRRGAPEVCA